MITQATKNVVFCQKTHTQYAIPLFCRYDNDKLNQAEKDALTVGQTPGSPIKHFSMLMTSCSLQESKHHIDR